MEHLAPSKKNLLLTPKCEVVAGETPSGGFCPDPVLFPADKAQGLSVCEDSAFSSMGACYPKCMGTVDDQMVLPGAQAKRSASAAMESTLYEAELVAKMQTFDLEELGLAAASQASHKKQEKSIIVDYEDSDGEHLELRPKEATCAPSACAPVLTGAESNNARHTRRRSRCGSSEVAATGSLRGKSVIFEKNIKSVEPESPNTSDTDAEEEMRCSKVHKLCMCEVKLHRSLESCWLVCSGQVYDVTGLVTAHPGGVRSILRKAGGPDCARDMKFHTKNARKMMEKCFIGKLQQCGDDVDCSGEANCSIM
ncbi:Nitrate reductase [Phytophthora nicotianae]|uniref:Nitrate reductase n=1 Tax=Phytophthora nicotianae TaxID=4792 RepID=A0A0W8E0U2_PHYNI|nr:Nitrate reductase [Phytophthora nicotianae]